MKAQQNQTNGNGDTMAMDSSSVMEATMTLSSPAFKNNAPIPQHFSCRGENISPALSWSGAPKEAKSFALLLEDPDAPSGTFYHWVIYNIPASEHGLAENIARRDPLPNGARQGTNSAQQLGYMGPCPPAGKAHRYYFKLYALDTEINIPGEATHERLVSALQGHILAEGEMIGTFAIKN